MNTDTPATTTQRKRHSSHDHEGQHRPGVPRCAATRRGAHAWAGEDEKEAARVFYVAATRATQRLVMEASGGVTFGRRVVC